MKNTLYAIKSLQNDIMRKSFHKDFNHRGPRNFAQVKIMEYLMENLDKDIHQKDFENVLNIRKSTLSGILDTMEKNEIITRVESNQDARSRVIKLSDKALAHHCDMHHFFKKMNTKITKDIPKEKLDTFFEVIEMMRKNIKNLEGENTEDVKND